MAKDSETGEPLIEFFQHSSINAVQRVLARAERMAQRESATQTRAVEVRRSKLIRSLNSAMAAWGRTAKGAASIRESAPDTGGRAFHFGYSTVTRGESARGKAGQTGTTAAPPTPTRGGRGRPVAGGKESAHQAYVERDGAVDQEANPIAATANERDRAGRGNGVDWEPEVGSEEIGERALGIGRAERSAAKNTGAREAGRSTAHGLPGLEARTSEAAAQKYIEDPAKLMGTTASFGTIGETLAERMAFWDLVHAHESAMGGRTQARMVLELPHEATPSQRTEIVQRFTDEFRRRGLPFWASIHQPTKDNDYRNHHAHVVLSERPAKVMPHPGTGEPTWDFAVAENYQTGTRHIRTRYPHRQNRDPTMRERGYVKAERERFAETVNAVMSEGGGAVRYDPRSYRDMGLDTAPMRNVSRILSDKLGKRRFVVMDAEWTRKVIDAEMQAAAARRDETFQALQAAESRIIEASRDARASAKANARLPPDLRVGVAGAFVRGVAEVALRRTLEIRRDRLAQRFADEAVLTALANVAAATGPGKAGGKQKNIQDPANAPDAADLAELHAAALEEINEQRLAAGGRQARLRAVEEREAAKWRRGGMPEPQGHGPGSVAPAAPTPAGDGSSFGGAAAAPAKQGWRQTAAKAAADAVPPKRGPDHPAWGTWGTPQSRWTSRGYGPPDGRQPAGGASAPRPTPAAEKARGPGLRERVNAQVSGWIEGLAGAPGGAEKYRAFIDGLVRENDGMQLHYLARDPLAASIFRAQDPERHVTMSEAIRRAGLIRMDAAIEAETVAADAALAAFPTAALPGATREQINAMTGHVPNRTLQAREYVRLIYNPETETRMMREEAKAAAAAATAATTAAAATGAAETTIASSAAVVPAAAPPALEAKTDSRGGRTPAYVRPPRAPRPEGEDFKVYVPRAKPAPTASQKVGPEKAGKKEVTAAGDAAGKPEAARTSGPPQNPGDRGDELPPPGQPAAFSVSTVRAQAVSGVQSAGTASLRPIAQAPTAVGMALPRLRPPAAEEPERIGSPDPKPKADGEGERLPVGRARVPLARRPRTDTAIEPQRADAVRGPDAENRVPTEHWPEKRPPVPGRIPCRPE